MAWRVLSNEPVCASADLPALIMPGVCCREVPCIAFSIRLRAMRPETPAASEVATCICPCPSPAPLERLDASRMCCCCCWLCCLTACATMGVSTKSLPTLSLLISRTWPGVVSTVVNVRIPSDLFGDKDCSPDEALSMSLAMSEGKVFILVLFP